MIIEIHNNLTFFHKFKMQREIIFVIRLTYEDIFLMNENSIIKYFFQFYL